MTSTTSTAHRRLAGAVVSVIVIVVLLTAGAHAAPAVTVPPIDRGATAAQAAVRLPAPGKLLFPVVPQRGCLVLDNYGQDRGGYIHVGEDILDAANAPIYAVVDGTLAKQYIAGTPTTVRSGNGWRLASSADAAYYSYFHLSGFAPGLQVGSVVNRGDVIGYVGDTGDAGPGNFHLHFEVHPTGDPSVTVDPLPLLDVPASCPIYHKP